MGRFEGDDNCEWSYAEALFWEQAKYNALHGKRGRKVLEELREALLAMPVHELAYVHLAGPEGQQCSLGVLATHRLMKQGMPREAAIATLHETHGFDDDWFDEHDAEEYTDDLRRSLGLRRAFGEAVAFENDGDSEDETPAQRWDHMLKWCEGLLAEPSLTRKAKAMPAERGPRGAGADALRAVEVAEDGAAGLSGTSREGSV